MNDFKKELVRVLKTVSSEVFQFQAPSNHSKMPCIIYQFGVINPALEGDAKWLAKEINFVVRVYVEKENENIRSDVEAKLEGLDKCFIQNQTFEIDSANEFVYTFTCFKK